MIVQEGTDLSDQLLVEERKTLSLEEERILDAQNSRLLNAYRAEKLEDEACKHWDLFYKRNETRFFKDRHWTTREFQELLGPAECAARRRLLEVGCGVGNLMFPLVEQDLNFDMIACDLSPRAVRLVMENPLFDAATMKAFQCDITTDAIFSQVSENSVDVVTVVFVLSAIHPDKFVDTLRRLWRLLKPGGLLLFRDYGLYDMAQLRFKPGRKIAENFYARHDGTRSYYFSKEFLQGILEQSDFQVVENSYIHRRTVNIKEKVDELRIFLQAKGKKNWL